MGISPMMLVCEPKNVSLRAMSFHLASLKIHYEKVAKFSRLG